MSHELPGPPGYCSSQLIPYLGNKRALLSRLMPVFRGLAEPGPRSVFLDPFAGSGSVSRLARAMGYSVEANDWEPYSQAVNQCWLGLRPSDLDAAFGGEAGLADFLADWNSMHPQAGSSALPASAAGEPYIARWYAPERTATPRLGSERLFYTAENAAFIDRVRHRVEAELGKAEPGSKEAAKRTVTLGALTLEAANHANTSGVFKAFHRGFGGHGRDALGRIMGRMELERPILVEAAASVVSRSDASAFVRGRGADIAYIDPPYNQHQYGSNYHILNTILRWDGLPMPIEGREGGNSAKAGIPEAWKGTRSPFCSKREAKVAIERLLDSLDAAHIVFSWNGDGHLSGEELAETLSARGSLQSIALEYVSYRGGRQSASRRVRSVEYLFVLRPGKPRRAAGEAGRELAERRAVDEALRAAYDPRRAEAMLPGSPFFDSGSRKAAAGARAYVESLAPDQRLELLAALKACACRDVPEEIRAALDSAYKALERDDMAGARRSATEAAKLLRKLAHAKHRDAYAQSRAALGKVASILGERSDGGLGLDKALGELDALFQARTAGRRSGD